MKRRKGRQREVRKRILILCEGETEKNYFQAIKEDSEYKQKLLAVHPKVVVAKNPTPEQVVKEALARATEQSKQGNPYDKIWVVFDHDNHPHRQKAYQSAIKTSFGVAFSAIAFETWYLLHFVKSTRAFSKADDLIDELRKHYASYEKAKQNDFAMLKSKLPAAFANARWLRMQGESSKDVTNCNPWTDVDVLVEELIGKTNHAS